MEYTVTWTIQLDADSPEHAARLALDIQRDPESIATHFVVRDADGEERAGLGWGAGLAVRGDKAPPRPPIIHCAKGAMVRWPWLHLVWG